jgi:hypothetical protein
VAAPFGRERDAGSVEPVSVQQAFRHRRIALLGLLAVLFQAILFGWHHHPVPLASRGAQAIAVAANSAVPLSPADAEDGCDICAALHHLSASPIEFVSLLLPTFVGSAAGFCAISFSVRPSERGFLARAPPRGSDIHV